MRPDNPIWFEQMVSSVTPGTAWGGTHKYVCLPFSKKDPTSRLIIAFGDFSQLDQMPFRTLSAQRDSRIYTCYNDLKVELIRRRDKKKCYDIHTDHLFVDAAMHDKLNSLVSGHITSWTRRAGTTKFVISDLAAQDSVSELDKNDRDCLAASGLYLTVIRAAKEAFQVLDKAYPHRMEVDSSAPSGGSNLEVVMLCERRPPRVAWNGRNDNNFQAALGIARQVLGVQLPKRRIASPQDLKDRFEQKRIG